MTKLWHCTPEEFDRQDMQMIDLHLAIYNEENKFEDKQRKRQEQRDKLRQTANP